MRGHIREYRPGKWSYTIYVGKVDGKPKKEEKGGFTSKSDAEAACSIKLAELATTGEIFKPSDMTLQDLFDEFISSATITRRPSTMVKHNTIRTHHIKEPLGHRFIKTLKPKDINDLMVKKIADGYSDGYVNSIFKTLSAMFLLAEEHQYIKTNIMTKASRPKVAKAPVDIFTPEQIQIILDAIANTNLLLPVKIGLNTGMRVGEVLGLRWKDIDFNTNTIKIDHQLLAEKGRYCIGETKTGRVRSIKITQELADYLQDKKKNQDLNKKIAGEFYKEIKVFNYFTNKTEIVTDFVCVKDNGAQINQGSLKYVDRVTTPLGVEFNFHKLRHTHATNLIENGASIKMVQERLGHARPDITLNVYSHVSSKYEQNILDVIPKF